MTEHQHNCCPTQSFQAEDRAMARNIHTSLRSEINADAISNGGSASLQRIIRLLLLHSGFQFLFAYRIQQRIRRGGALGSFLADLILKFATDLTGCHIHPNAYLEGGIHLPHATGIVIGAGAVVRSSATIYQNVTLGRRTGLGDYDDYPELRQGCHVYPGAQILGKIVIGENAQVGANAVVLESVPNSAIAVGIPARIIQGRS